MLTVKGNDGIFGCEHPRCIPKPYLSEIEQIEVFSNSVITITKHKLELEEMLEENSKTPLNVRGLFEHPIRILGTDLEFLEWVLEEINKGGGQIDPESYGK